MSRSAFCLGRTGASTIGFRWADMTGEWGQLGVGARAVRPLRPSRRDEASRPHIGTDKDHEDVVTRGPSPREIKIKIK